MKKASGHILTLTLKVTCIGIVLLLCVSLFATGLMAAADCGTRCCCGITSQVRAQQAMPMKIQSPQSCCTGSDPMPCDIQNSPPHKLPDALFTSSHNSNLPTIISLVGLDSVDPTPDAGGCTNHSVSINQHFRSPPLYLANLAILA